MSYCRFENTASDLVDCENHMDDTLTSEYEIKARRRLLKTCKSIAENYDEDTLNDDTEEDEEEDEEDEEETCSECEDSCLKADLMDGKCMSCFENAKSKEDDDNE